MPDESGPDLTGSGAAPLQDDDPQRIGPIPLIGRLGAGAWAGSTSVSTRELRGRQATPALGRRRGPGLPAALRARVGQPGPAARARDRAAARR
ncbi:hypothetical protein NKH77_17525 [Streptomyces sp. M19]